MKSDLLLSNGGFLDLVKERHAKTPARPFCWVLGTGASAASGIPLGRELTQRWLTEMYDRVAQPKPTLKEWVNQEFDNVPGFTYERAANFYPYIYQSRYRQNPAEGLAFFESLLEKAKPSFGYKVLAQIMAHTKHKVALTTNPDNLLSISIVLYTDKEPFVCGSDSLADFIITTLRRPLIAKIHREFLLGSRNDPDEIIHLADDWKQPLAAIFQRYTPVVVGFGDDGGSGGSFIRFLQELAPLENGIFWCYRDKKGNLPAQEIQSLVAHHKGRVVPTLGFDSLMFQFWVILNLTSVESALEDKYQRLVKEYRDGFSSVAEWILALEDPENTDTEKSVIQSAKSALARLREDSFL